MERTLTDNLIARNQRVIVYSRSNGAPDGDRVFPTSQTFKPQTEAATQSTNDGFLYQRRVSPKISARVGCNRNGEGNGFCRIVRIFPGNECVVDKSGRSVRPRTNRPRVPVPTRSKVKPVLTSNDGYQLEAISRRERVSTADQTLTKER